MRHRFDEMELERIVADVDPTHTASVRVLEKVGFVQVGEHDGKLLYALERAEWSRRLLDFRERG